MLCTLALHSDINECEMNTTVCPENATCANTPGDYECQCLEGYRYNITENLCEGKYFANMYKPIPLQLHLTIIIIINPSIVVTLCV